MILVMHYMHTGIVLPSLIGDTKLQIEYKTKNKQSGSIIAQSVEALLVNIEQRMRSYQRFRLWSKVFCASIGAAIWAVMFFFSLKYTCLDIT